MFKHKSSQKCIPCVFNLDAMSVLLLHTIGNRDLQFAKSALFPGGFQETYLETNFEDQSYFVLRKDSHPGGESFWRRSLNLQHLLKYDPNPEPVRTAMSFPMLEAAIGYVNQHIGRIDKLVLSTTLQTTPHKYDTDAIGEIAREYLLEHYSRETQVGRVFMESMHIAPVGKGKLDILLHFHQLMKKLKDQGFAHIIISNQQGLPDASSALTFVGFFQNYTYLSIHPKEGVKVVDHGTHEQILSDLVKEKVIQLIASTDLSQISKGSSLSSDGE